MSYIQCVRCGGFFGMINTVIYTCRCGNKALFCNHANENPLRCPCEQDCYCKVYTCNSTENRTNGKQMHD